MLGGQALAKDFPPDAADDVDPGIGGSEP